MTHLSLILLPSLLALSHPCWAEARPAQQGKDSQARPLNLSLPRDIHQTPADRPDNETVERNLRAPAPTTEPASPARPTHLPYGSGYEHRHRETGGASPASGSGPGKGPGSASGAGRRGR